MKHCYFYLTLLVIFTVGCNRQEQPLPVDFKTVCNPVDLSYRFCLTKPSRREAADPSIVLFKGEYYMFVSKSGGYFHSVDLINWNLIVPENLP
ncbi:MAG: carbohydrate-binding protein, partial [Prevotellaceae bacterium]|nr:carbohydrate-binding protein [Prevotellaceae bacterium]